MTVAAIFAAMALGLAHSPAPVQDCAYTVPVLGLDHSRIMSGNMRTTDGGCIVWVNALYLPALRRRDICKLGAHEAGHLGGLTHSADPLSVMYSPFQPDPVAPGCDRPRSHHR